MNAPFRISACAVVAGYNLRLMEWEHSPDVHKLKLGSAQHRYFAGTC